MKGLAELVARFTDGKVAVVGDLMVDEFIWGTVERISPEAPVPVVDIKSQTYTPGGAANVACNIAALGGEVFLFGVVGEDKESEYLLSELERRGIKSIGVVVDKARPTTLKSRIIAHSQQVVRVDREKREPIVGLLVSEIVQQFETYIDRFNILILSDYAKGVITSALVESLLPLCKERGIKVVVDPKPQNWRLYKGAYIVTPNRHEAEIISGISITDEAALISAGEHLLEMLNTESLLITRGEEGMTLFEGSGEITHIETAAHEVYDVTGAGDTVVAVIGLSLSCGADVKSAARLSNLAAGVVVEKVGTAVVNQQELHSRIEG